MNKDIKQLAEETLKKHVGNDTMPVKKVNILSAMVEMYTAGAREATNHLQRLKNVVQLMINNGGDPDLFAVMRHIEKLEGNVATTTPLSSSSGEAPVNSNNSIGQEGGYYYDLFKFFSDNHNLILVDSEIQDIIHAVEKFNNHPVRRIINDTWDGRCRCGHLHSETQGK
jgi:hypothetical protein